MSAASLPWNITQIADQFFDKQTRIKNTVDVTQTILMLIALFLTFRIIFIRQKSRLLVLTILMIVEGIFSIVAASCTQQLFVIGSTADLTTDNVKNRAMRLYYTYAWSLGIAGICYNVSHWMLAVQYWSLSTKLEAMLDGQSIKTFTFRLRCLFFVGLLLNISTGITTILTAYYK
jgi:hypothetical protein